MCPSENVTISSAVESDFKNKQSVRRLEERKVKPKVALGIGRQTVIRFHKLGTLWSSTFSKSRSGLENLENIIGYGKA